jgi:superfamily II DNA or RNA helicase
MKLQLRDYQRDQVNAVCREARAGRNRAVVASAVGTGKSVVIGELCRLAKRPLVISPALSVMEQLADNMANWLGEFVDVEQGSRWVSRNSMMRSRVIVASRDSLLSRDRYQRGTFDDTSLVIFDECHRGMTDRMTKMLNWFEDQGAFIVGLSATPYKGKGNPLPWWSRPCYSKSLLDAIREGWLVRPRGILSEASSLDLRIVEDSAGDWNQEQLAEVLNAEQVVHEIANLVMQTYRAQPSAVYCQNIRQAQLLAEVLGRWGADPAIVYSRQDPEERKANMLAFREGRTKIICNVNVLAYGWDFPALRNIYNAAPTRSLAAYEQRIGRGTRPLAGVLSSHMTMEERLAAIAGSDKPFFTIYDITDSSRHIQLLNAMDVIDAEGREDEGRRKKNREGMEGSNGEPADLLDELAKRDEEASIQEEIRRAELREKRNKLVVGYTFSHNSRDLFSSPEEGRSRRGFRMMWGKYKGELIRDLPTSYLQYVERSARKVNPFVAAVRREIKSRDGLEN